MVYYSDCIIISARWPMLSSSIIALPEARPQFCLSESRRKMMPMKWAGRRDKRQWAGPGSVLLQEIVFLSPTSSHLLLAGFVSRKNYYQRRRPNPYRILFLTIQNFCVTSSLFFGQRKCRPRSFVESRPNWPFGTCIWLIRAGRAGGRPVPPISRRRRRFRKCVSRPPPHSNRKLNIHPFIFPKLPN